MIREEKILVLWDVSRRLQCLTLLTRANLLRSAVFGAESAETRPVRLLADKIRSDPK